MMLNYKKMWMKLREIAYDNDDSVLMSTIMAIENECEEEIQIPAFLKRAKERELCESNI